MNQLLIASLTGYTILSDILPAYGQHLHGGLVISFIFMMKLFLLVTLATSMYLSGVDLTTPKCEKTASGSRYQFWLTVSDEKTNVEEIYTEWRNKADQDVRYFIGTYWARLVDDIGSDISLFADNANRLQKMASVRDDLKKACENWGTYDSIWPYSCYSKEFNCKFYEAVQASYDAANIGTDKQKIASRIGPDTEARAVAVDKLFDFNILAYLPPDFADEAFYSSGFIKQIYYKLYQYQKQTPGLFVLDDWNNWSIVKDIVTKRCTDNADSVVAKKYYCKAKDIMSILQPCLNSPVSEACTFDPRLQRFWDTGSPLDYWRQISNVPVEIVTRTVTYFLQNVFSLFEADNYQGLKTFLNYYLPYLTVEDKFCRQGWSKRITCTTDKCKSLFTYRPDCSLKVLANAAQKYVDLRSSGKSATDQSVKDVTYAMITWKIYPYVAEILPGSTVSLPILTEIQKRISDILKTYDVNALAEFAMRFPPARFTAAYIIGKKCRPVVSAYSSFCIIEPTITTIQDIGDNVRASKSKTSIKLNPSINYAELLKQLQLQETKNSIMKQTDKLFNDLTVSLKQNFLQLADYFSTMASYDAKKAQADIGYIKGRLDKFEGMVTKLSEIAAKSLRVIMITSLAATIAELVQRIAEFAIQIVAACNPFKHLAGGAVEDLMAAIDNMVQAGVNLAIVGSIVANGLPDLAKRGQKLGNGFASNKQQLELTKKVIDGLYAGNVDIEESVNEFLTMYNDYSPVVLRSDITGFGEKYISVASALCDAAFAGSSAASGLAEIGLASSGDCYKISAQITELFTVYEEMYDYQFDLMDALANAARSYLAQKKANDMKAIYSKGPSETKLFLQQNTITTFALSTFFVWGVVVEYCNKLSYMKGGKMVGVCTTAINNPSFISISDVIAYRQTPVCDTNNEITHYVSIPTKSTTKGDKSYIDLQCLYKRIGCLFKISDPQWLVNKGWIDGDQLGYAPYVKKFELYLPPMSGLQKHTIKLTVTPGITSKLLPSSKKSYIIPMNGYTLRYYENGFNCYTPEVKNPYAICKATDAPKLCVTSNGEIDNDIKPTLYTDWTINADSLPSGQPIPNPKTDFKIQGAITLCMIPTSNQKRSVEIKKREKSYVEKRGTQHCCESTQYWNAGCKECPSGSTQRLAGYYCE